MKLKNNSEDFRKNMHKLWQEDQYCDVILTDVDKKTRILAHRLVLAASSTYFADKTAQSNCLKEIVVTEIEGDILQQLVDVCYSGTLEVNEENVSSLYMGAVQFQLSSVLVTMENYIETQLNNFNCLNFYHLAETCSRSSLLDATKNYICAHFNEIVDQSFFLELSAIELKVLLSLEGLQESSAEDIFRSVMKWFQHDPDRRSGVFSELLPILRLSLMSSKFLLDHVTPHCKTVEAKDLILAALETKFESIPPILTDAKSLPVPVDVGRETLFVVAKVDYLNFEIMEYSFERQDWITVGVLPTNISNFSVTYSKALNSLCFVGGHLKDVLLWNLQTRKFSKSTSMIESRLSPSVISLNDGSDEDGDLIVVGGLNNNYIPLSKAERWSRKSGEWYSLLPAKVESQYGRLVIIGNIMYWIVGELTVHSYNLTENCWSTLASFFYNKRSNFGIMIDGGKIYIIGGGQDEILCYYPARNKCSQVCTVEGSKYIETCVRHNNRLFAFGNGIVLTSDGNWKVWKRSDTIKAIGFDIYGAFSIPLQ